MSTATPRVGRRAAMIAGVTLGIVGLTAGTALARWSTTGAGTGSATTTTINPPLTGNVTLTSAANAVNVAVSTAPAAGAPVQGYRVDRTLPTALVGACFITATTGNCNAPADGAGSQTYDIVSYRGNQTLQYWNSAPLSRTGTPTSSALVITGLGGSVTGNVKPNFKGTGATSAATITVRVCTTNVTCTSGNQTTSATATGNADGTWTSTNTAGNLNSGTTYFATAVQTTPAKTSATVSFQAP